MRASPETLGRTLATAPDPGLARVALSRVGESAEAREALEQHLQAAAALLGFSTAATDFLVAHPDETAAVLDARPAGHAALAEELAADVERFGYRPGLRRFRRRAVWRLATRDLLGAAVDDVMAEMTAIAEVCLAQAATAAGGGLAVIGMGKLGGGELNYASDVDVIFVHDGSTQEASSRVAQAFIAMLAEPTADGVALRIDADLRPEGRAGALSRSLAATIGYYRKHAATWERQALLKARPVAGDLELGARLLDALAPVIYPEHLDASAIEDVRAMKVRIEEYVRARGKHAVEVKRGRGGIRDVEFAVQLLQLVHGRRDSRLRAPGTLPALAALAEEGYVALDDAETLAASYRFLRSLEHRLQLHRELQTHELPTEPGAQRRLARSMGLDDAGALHATHAEHTAVVRGLHERLFYRPLLEAFAGPRVPRPGTDRVATEELLAGLGFRDPATAYERLSRLVDPATRAGKVLAHVFPVLAAPLALAVEPDAALVRLERVVERRGEDEADRLASDPELARRMALVAGTSAWLSDVLARGPLELLRGDGGRSLTGLLTEHALLAVGADYVGGTVRVPDVGRRLTRVADAAVAGALADAGSGVPLAVIGLGKFGGEELNFASDLDVVFVFEGEGAADFEEAERGAVAVMAGVAARGFEPDADLRPEGKSGPLARSMAAFLEYWQRWGQTWEFQSLLKARFVAGDESLGRRFLSAASDLAYPEQLPLDRVAEIRRMRVRMENERVKPADARRFHFKLGYGGLADVQFAVELSLMRHGREHPEARRRHTLEALEALARARRVEDSVALALGEAYVFLNEVKNALELDRRIPAEAMPPSPEGQLALARRLGYEEASRRRFMEDYRRITRRARRAMERVFYEEDTATGGEGAP
jgi:glutamate-ammonia-ligase adenylyltransferase